MKKRIDTIGWQGELLVWDILKRNTLNMVTHNSMADADNPLIGISFHGVDIRIPEPDFSVTNRGGTLFTSRLPSRELWIEVKTKTSFGYFELGSVVTTGFDNYLLEQYYQLNEECGKTIEIYFVHIFPLKQMRDGTLISSEAVTGIYKADIRELYNTRWNPFGGSMAYWPIEGSVLVLVNTMHELLKSPDTRNRCLLLREIGRGDPRIINYLETQTTK